MKLLLRFFSGAVNFQPGRRATSAMAQVAGTQTAVGPADASNAREIRDRAGMSCLFVFICRCLAGLDRRGVSERIPVEIARADCSERRERRIFPSGRQHRLLPGNGSNGNNNPCNALNDRRLCESAFPRKFLFIFRHATTPMDSGKAVDFRVPRVSRNSGGKNSKSATDLTLITDLDTCCGRVSGVRAVEVGQEKRVKHENAADETAPQSTKSTPGTKKFFAKSAGRLEKAGKLHLKIKH